jgi:hypothetical protein
MTNEFIQSLIIVTFAVCGTLLVISSITLYKLFKEPIKDE